MPICSRGSSRDFKYLFFKDANQLIIKTPLSSISLTNVTNHLKRGCHQSRSDCSCPRPTHGLVTNPKIRTLLLQIDKTDNKKEVECRKLKSTERERTPASSKREKRSRENEINESKATIQFIDTQDQSSPNENPNPVENIENIAPHPSYNPYARPNPHDNSYPRGHDQIPYVNPYNIDPYGNPVHPYANPNFHHHVTTNTNIIPCESNANPHESVQCPYVNNRNSYENIPNANINNSDLYETYPNVNESYPSGNNAGPDPHFGNPNGNIPNPYGTNPSMYGNETLGPHERPLGPCPYGNNINPYVNYPNPYGNEFNPYGNNINPYQNTPEFLPRPCPHPAHTSANRYQYANESMQGYQYGNTNLKPKESKQSPKFPRKNSKSCSALTGVKAAEGNASTDSVRSIRQKFERQNSEVEIPVQSRLSSRSSDRKTRVQNLVKRFESFSFSERFDVAFERLSKCHDKIFEEQKYGLTPPEYPYCPCSIQPCRRKSGACTKRRNKSPHRILGHESNDSSKCPQKEWNRKGIRRSPGFAKLPKQKQDCCSSSCTKLPQVRMKKVCSHRCTSKPATIDDRDITMHIGTKEVSDFIKALSMGNSAGSHEATLYVDSDKVPQLIKQLGSESENRHGAGSKLLPEILSMLTKFKTAADEEKPGNSSNQTIHVAAKDLPEILNLLSKNKNVHFADG